MRESPLLYYITNRVAFPGDESTRRRRLLEKIAEAASAGVDYIQLREKDLSARELESLAGEAIGLINQLRAENRTVRTALLINSRTDIALTAEADGVHLRADDISPEDVRTAWRHSPCAAASARSAQIQARDKSPQDPLIAVSCHSPEEVMEAASGHANLVVFGPVFEKGDAPVSAKSDAPGSAPAGLEALREACRATIPVLALGGVTVQNAASCLRAGAAGIAGIRLFQENEIAKIVHSLRA